MENLDFIQDAVLGFDPFDPRTQNYNILQQSTWSLPMLQNMADQYATQRRADMVNTTTPLQTSGLGLGFSQSMNPPAGLLTNDWRYQYHQPALQPYNQDSSLNAPFNTVFGGALQTSSIDFMPISTTAMNNNMTMSSAMNPASYMAYSGPMESMGTMAYTLENYQNDVLNYQTSVINESLIAESNELNRTTQELNATAHEYIQSSISGSSPTDSWLEVRSNSDNGWTNVDYPTSQQSNDSYTNMPNSAVFNPSQTLHIRTDSESSASDVLHSANISGSYEEIPFPLHSPLSEINADFTQQTVSEALPHVHQDHHRYHHSSDPPAIVSPSSTHEAVPVKNTSSSSTSPASSGAISPPTRARKSPTAKVTKAAIRKISAGSSKKDEGSGKRIGKRKGPLKPEQRQQAHEIRKMRACLRCKFLKKICDKGDVCNGCQPSHARLWQVPCTRIGIQEIAYFMKGWKADYERHVSIGFSVDNIKGFSQIERTLYITHGFGHYLPVMAREVYVRNENCFDIDWIETLHEKPREFEVPTARLSAGMEGVSAQLLSDYLDCHIDTGFEGFVDEYFEGIPFLTEVLKTAYRYYLREKLPIIRQALKLVLAYNLTLHVTMVEGLSEEEAFVGTIDDNRSKWNGKTFAPVMINFQVKCALADMWRELQREILEELSSLYNAVYAGEKKKSWPTIFMLSAILLAVWEEMQFDCHYQIRDEKVVQKFCDDMETTPVGVVVGMFHAISQKLPGLMEWDTRKHHHLLGSKPAGCDALTELRGHLTKHERYLRSRSNTKFDRSNFDCLSNKFLSKLFIKA